MDFLNIAFELSLLFWVVIAIISIIVVHLMMKTMRKLSRSRYIVERKMRLKLKPIFLKVYLLLGLLNILSLAAPVFFTILNSMGGIFCN